MDARVDIQLKLFIEQLFSLQGLFAVLVFVLALVVMAVSSKAKWAVLPLLLDVAILGRPWNVTDEFALVFPLEQIRTQSRVVCIALMLLLLVSSVRAWVGWRQRAVLAGAVMYFVFQLVFSTTLVAGGDVSRGVFGAVTHVLIFFTLAWGVSRWLQDLPDAVAVVRCVVVAAALFCLATIWQLVINQSAAIQNGRLVAIAGNAQAAATVIASAMLPCFYLLVRKGEPRAWRILGGATAGVLIGMLLWTGSRTGALMSLTGLIVLFRFRAGKLLLGAMIAGAFAMLIMHLFADSGSNLDRFTDSTDTRTHVWRAQWEAFLTNPVTGGSLVEGKGSENSYLDVAARTGLVGLIPLGAAMVLVAVSLVRINRMKAALGPEGMLVDLITGGIVALAVGAFFEGYLVGIYSFMVFLLYLYATLMIFVIDYAHAVQGEVPGELQLDPSAADAAHPAHEPAMAMWHASEGRA